MIHDEPAQLKLVGVSVQYADCTVLQEIGFVLEPGEIGCLMGASGSGKSTLLRAIAGFELPQAGRISLRGCDLFSDTANVPAHQRRVGMVFQDHALFPHLDVAANVGFGLCALDKQQRTRRVNELLEMIDLSDFGRRFPHELSGGQQQRVALARALAPRPSLLLLDEPFANLDSDLRKRLALDVRTWLKTHNTTALLVTHDRQEAFSFADRLGLLANSRLQQWDTPYVLHHQPVNSLVADFMGEGVWLQASVVSEFCLRLPLGEFCRLHALPAESGGTVRVLIRPDDVVHDDFSPLRATVISRQFLGSQFLCRLALEDGTQVLSLLGSHHDHAEGSQIGIRIELDHLVAFSA